MINAEVLLQNGDEVQNAKVIQHSIGPDGTIVGTYNDNPQMNSIVYDVEFPDGQVKEYSSNLIADNIISQVDNDGFSKSLLEAIVDYRKDELIATPTQDKYVFLKSGQC